MTNIPIYRAKKIDSDEYTMGYLMKADDYTCDEDEDQVVYFIMHKMENYRTDLVWDFVCNSRIDPSTLAIHFPDMLDSQGNKIFASLSEDGKGGDCTFMDNGYNEVFTFDNINMCIVLKSAHFEARLFGNGRGKTGINKYTVVGIQQ